MKLSIINIVLWAPWSASSFSLVPRVVNPHATTTNKKSITATTTTTTTTIYAEVESQDSTSPTTLPQHSIRIDYCTGCRWMLKSFWMAQELLTTFEEDLESVTVVPSTSKGIFSIQLDNQDILWDRKEQGGFPSPKGLKQLIRDLVEPNKYLGHSDTTERQEEHVVVDEEGVKVDAVVSRDEVASSASMETSSSSSSSSPSSQLLPQPNIAIHYCTGCRWLLRGAYFGQELLTTFGDGEIESVTLVPSKPPANGGQFTIELNGETLFDRATEGRFPEVKEIKQLIRDRLVPDKDLGHSDVVVADQEQEEEDDDDDDASDDKDAEDQRQFFGVA